MGFAIPIDTVSRAVPQLIQGGSVVRAGLNVQVASDAVARKLRVPSGALLQGVAAGSTAAAAGLLPTRRGLGGIVAGDVITAVDGTAVVSASDLANVLERYKMGDTVELAVTRAGDQVCALGR